MARPSATDRLARILSMVPWIASQDSPRIDEVCERFEITREELVADLDVVFVVGLYPYTPESLIEVILDEDHVSIDYTNFFERPLRLSKDEALAILAAGVASPCPCIFCFTCSNCSGFEKVLITQSPTTSNK